MSRNPSDVAAIELLRRGVREPQDGTRRVPVGIWVFVLGVAVLSELPIVRPIAWVLAIGSLALAIAAASLLVGNRLQRRARATASGVLITPDGHDLIRMDSDKG
jgi:hypothetical protein